MEKTDSPRSAAWMAKIPPKEEVVPGFIYRATRFFGSLVGFNQPTQVEPELNDEEEHPQFVGSFVGPL